MKKDKETALETEDVGLKDKIASLPPEPGVYLYKNSNGKIIYVGKAKHLRNRVRSYFQAGRPVDAKTKALVSKISDVEVILVDSEAEALILEDTLIKKYKPRYNILLRDDKSYPYVRITNEDYPRIFTTRNIVRDGSKYFGPYTELRPLKQLMKTLRTIFKFRSCDYRINDKSIEEKKHQICLDYHIDKCEGPCEGLVSKEEYNENVRHAIRILNGKTRELEKMLEDQMASLSDEFKFEDAAIVRNKLLLLKDYSSKQKIVTTEIIDRDVFGLARVEEDACTLVFKIRDGKMVGKRHFIIKGAIDQSDKRIIQRTIEKWYLESDFVPGELFLPEEPEQTEYLLDWLGKKRGKTIHIQIPKIGEKKKLVEMAGTNAGFILREYHLAISKREQAIPRPLISLKRDLRLQELPSRIECFDNSHIQGSELVSSMVVFIDGKPRKSEYRKFKIRTVKKNDDFAAMREVIQRRYSRVKEEDGPYPDLVIVDGGKGQLSSAYEILTNLKLNDRIRIIGLAKKLEEVFVPGTSEPVVLPKTSSSLRLIQQLRDEAHRFAITYHRKLRDKRTLQTELTNIPAIGTKTAEKLLKEFGSVENIRNATEDDLKEIVGPKIALNISGHFRETLIQTDEE